MNKKYVVFFIGTIAEYIKLFPVIEEMKKTNTPYKVIASGQNEIINSDIAVATGLKIDCQLSNEKDIVKNVFGLFYWFFKALSRAKKQILNALDGVDFERSIMVVHGDTLSTVIGAVVAKELKMKVAHVEAGLRSHHLFSPFPEEIDRLTVSKIADYNYCQGETAKENLKKSKGQVIDTKYNTVIDATNFTKGIEISNNQINSIINQPFCIFVIHRQENLIQSNLVRQVVDKAIDVSKNKLVVFVMHKITENTLKKLNLLDKLLNEKNVIPVKRLEYFDFTKLIINSDFVITDGGSNQEELCYLGKPTLVLRTATERTEGIGENAVMFNGDIDTVSSFADEYEKYQKPPVIADISPSKVIAEHLTNEINNL